MYRLEVLYELHKLGQRNGESAKITLESPTKTGSGSSKEG